MTKDELRLACENVFSGLNISFEEAEYLEESTHLQFPFTTMVWTSNRTNFAIDPSLSWWSSTKLMQKPRLNSMTVPAPTLGIVPQLMILH